MPKEPVSSVVPETPWDKTPMAYHVVPPTDEDGDPDGATPAAKAAATRAAHALSSDAKAGAADKEK